MAAAAGVTSGAVYRHLESKEQLFYEVAREGMERLIKRLKKNRRRNDTPWINAFIQQYIVHSHVSEIAEGSLLPALSTDMARANDTTRAEFSSGLKHAVSILKKSDHGTTLDSDRAHLLLATLLGSVILARATGNARTRKSLERALLAEYY